MASSPCLYLAALMSTGLLSILPVYAGSFSNTIDVSCFNPAKPEITGYCDVDAEFTFRYQNGANVRIPAMHIKNAKVVVGYCNRRSDGFASDCVHAKATPIPDSFTDGSHTWGETLSMVTGTFKIRSRPWNTGYGYCASAWLSPYPAGGGGGQPTASWGTTYSEAGKGAYCAGYAPPPPPPDLCYINAGNPLNVEFGNVERLDIATATGTHDVSKSLTVNCLGTDVHSINVKLSMTPTSWSTSQIATSNTALGVSVSTGGKTLSNNDSFDMAINGSSTANLTFSLLRNPKTQATAVATGAFTASATLVVTEP